MVPDADLKTRSEIGMRLWLLSQQAGDPRNTALDNEILIKRTNELRKRIGLYPLVA